MVVRPAGRAQSRGRISSRTYDGTTAAPVRERRARRARPRPRYAPNTRARCASPPGATSARPTTCFPGRIDEVAVYGGGALGARGSRRTHAAGTGSSGSGVVETVLIEDWCQQFPTGSVGGLEFGTDGALYMTGRRGRELHVQRLGAARATRSNPCGDPPGGVGRDAHAADGRGRLAPQPGPPHDRRSRRARRDADPRRQEHRRGNAGQPARRRTPTRTRGASSPTASGTRTGSRSVRGRATSGSATSAPGRPRRSTACPTPPMRPSRTSAGRATRAEPAGSGFDAADLTICENLYARAGAVTPPFFAYQHGATVVADRELLDDDRARRSRASRSRRRGQRVSRRRYDGALFFADYARSCIWAMAPDASGHPEPGDRDRRSSQDAAFPVDLQFGPDGRLYYVDVGDDGEGRSGGSTTSPATSRRSPSATATPDERAGAADRRTSTARARRDPDGTIAAYAWDLDGDGAVRRLDRAEPVVHLHDGGHVHRAPARHGQPGRAGRLRPDHDHRREQRADGVHRHACRRRSRGARASRSRSPGHGTDPEDGTIPASAPELGRDPRSTARTPSELPQPHRPDVPGRRERDVQRARITSIRRSSSSSSPSTDSSGIASSTTVGASNPRTVTLTMQTLAFGPVARREQQPGADDAVHARPWSRARRRRSARRRRRALGGTSYAFSCWSDGGAQTHTLTANATATYTATYTAQGGGGSSYSADGPRRLAACLLAPGRGERHDRRRRERQRPHGLVRATPTLGPAGRADRRLEHGGRLQRLDRVRRTCPTRRRSTRPSSRSRPGRTSPAARAPTARS